MIIEIFSAILFCISANLDNIVIGIAYGSKNIKIKLVPNLFIALITSISTFLSMYIGKLFIHFIPSEYASRIGSLIIILLGIYFFLQSILHLYQDNQKINSVALKNVNDMIPYALETDKDHSHFIDLKEALSVSFTLTFNNIRCRNCSKCYWNK